MWEMIRLLFFFSLSLSLSGQEIQFLFSFLLRILYFSSRDAKLDMLGWRKGRVGDAAEEEEEEEEKEEEEAKLDSQRGGGERDIFRLPPPSPLLFLPSKWSVQKKSREKKGKTFLRPCACKSGRRKQENFLATNPSRFHASSASDQEGDKRTFFSVLLFCKTSNFPNMVLVYIQHAHAQCTVKHMLISFFFSFLEIT